MPCKPALRQAQEVVRFMPFASAAFSTDPYHEEWRPTERTGLFRQLRNASYFLRNLRFQLRYGKLSRAPLQLLRFQVIAENVECDWIARSPDPWDVGLPRQIQNWHTSLQALSDAIEIRSLLFESLPQANTAHLRVFRKSGDCEPEMIITGCTHRVDHSSRNLHSLIMRAKILGFRFNLEGDWLQRI